jgi:hypothetical protein
MNVRRILGTIVLLSLSLGFIEAASAEETIRHRFLALDFWHGKLYHVDQFDPSQSWEMPWGGGEGHAAHRPGSVKDLCGRRLHGL